MNSIVIIGGGHAGAQLCASLAEAGLGPQVHLVCEEPELPYQRPPLSKAYLKDASQPLQNHRVASWYEQAGITVHAADPAVRIARDSRVVHLRSGAALPYQHLVLATGTRARRLAGWPTTLSNVAVLRTAADAVALRAQLGQAQSLTVLGGGFIGLEVAATAKALGLDVTVIEAAPRLMGRSVSAELSAHVLAVHQAAGIQVLLGAQVGAAHHEGDRLLSLQVNGQDRPIDLLLLGIGAEANTALAEAAGLAVDNGIVVDAQMRSSDPAVLAVGDVARFPVASAWAPAGSQARLESVQNANDQARTAVATVQGQNTAYAALPWFWSEQGSMRLQMVGLLPAPGTPGASVHRRPGANDASFSLLHYVGDKLVCVESVNAAMDHMTARKLLEGGRHPAPAQACDPAVPLKSLV